ncbi:MAG: molybdopterin cofactor-binding domain-containing protein [Pseudomonadota bacterium]
MAKRKTLTRRALLIGSAAVAGGVVFGVWRYKTPYANPLLQTLEEGEVALTPYLRLDASGITIITPRAEMGQGIHTTLAALVAEELDVDLKDVAVEHGPASAAYFNAALVEDSLPYAMTDDSGSAERARRFSRIPAKFLGMQITGGSASIPDGYTKMRVAGAAARDVLLQAASERSGVAVDALKTISGNVVLPDGNKLAYTELAEAAAKFEPPSEPKLKAKSSWRLLGKSQPRVDVVVKSTGKAEYAMDLRLPGMRFATVKRNPHLGSEMIGFDASEALAMPGVEATVALNDGVIIVANNTWRAFKAADAVKFEWSEPTYPESSQTMLEQTAAAIDDDLEDSRMRDDGEVDAALLEVDVVSGEYRVPLLAHATMEPMNATAWLRANRLDVWAGNQNPTQARQDAAAIADIDEANVHIHTTYMGGGFGRRAEMDFIQHAVHAAVAIPGTPVNVVWSREEDMTHDQYRPAAVARFRGAIDSRGISALDIKVSAPSVMESQLGRLGLPVLGSDMTIVQGAWDQPYNFANYRVTGYRPEVMIPITSWRSVGNSQNGFFQESMIDELANSVGLDPLEVRLAHIDHVPSRRVIEAVAEMSEWGSVRPEGHGLGLAFVLSFGVPVAQVIEVAVDDGRVRLLNAWIAADVGIALDPRNIEAQLQGGMNFGLSAAISGEITVTEGKVDQTNFHQSDGIRIHQSPNFAVRILENGDKIRGVGEPGLPPAAPALANAVFAATGKRIRELPMNKHLRFV